MLEEGSCAMEKKITARQSQGQCKLIVATGDRKPDSTPNRHGYGRRSGSGGASKLQDIQTPRPIPVQKWDKSYGDKRQRQRNYQNDRQREKVAETDDILYDVVSTGSRKGNANHLLNFRLTPYHNHGDDHRWYNRNRFSSHGHGGYKKATRYKKEQFLQASCQFVVRDTGDYAEQAIDSDALVDWSTVELVRSYSTEPVTCPICLHIPLAGKIAKCGHGFCWACILHYIKLGEKDDRKCPICYNTVDLKELKSVQWIDVPDYKIGDDIEMRLMRRSKGSTFAVPKSQWKDMQGKPMNIQDGNNTKFMKLLVASCDQIKTDVINRERDALMLQMADAEESEVPFIEMALELLHTREKFLKQVFQQTSDDKDKVYIPGLSTNMINQTTKKSHEEQNYVKSECSPQNVTVYADAFEEELEESNKKQENAENTTDSTKDLEGEVESQPCDNNPMPFGSPPCPFPPMQDAEVNALPLSLEETAEQLELPMDIPQAEKQLRKAQTLNTNDDYFFFQASTGQHIYLNSLNAQCLAKEYGSLEESPDIITGKIVAIERIFMTEDVRKRLRYLSHIPLTCEFHVVELKLKPPIVSKETLKLFEAVFDKRRKMRQHKARDEKKRAKKFEMEHRKSFGLYPEMQIPLDNMAQFPSHLTASHSVDEGLVEDMFPVVSLSVPESGQEQKADSGIVTSPRIRNDSTTSEESSSSSSVSFAQMLKAGKVNSSPRGAWGRAVAPPSLTGPSDLLYVSRSWKVEEDSDGEGLQAPSYSESMSDAIAKALDSIDLKGQRSGNASDVRPGAGGRKKRKEKKILFSTAMARMN